VILPSGRFALGLTLAGVPFAAALWNPPLAGVGWITLIALAAISALDLAFAPRRRGYEVDIAAASVFSLAEEEILTVRLRRRAGPAGRVRVRPVVPLEWKASRAWEDVALPPRGEAVATFRVVPAKRGRYVAGPVHVRLPSALGLFRRDLRFDATAEVRVYPAVADIKKYALLSRRLRVREMGLRPHRMRGQGMEFARLREYHRDDDVRRIDWKATARRGRLISREYQVERCQNVVLMIDAGRMLTEEVDGIVKIEYVLNASLLLTRIAAQHDDRVGALVFTDRVERLTPLRKGQGAVGAMAEALFDVQPKLCESDYEGAFRSLNTRVRKRALVVLFTNLVDQETSALVSGYLKSLAWRHVPLCVAVGDREVREAAWSVPETPHDAYRKAAAAHLSVSRARTLQELQRAGVRVVDAPAGQVPMAVLDKYLDLKARQAL